MKVKIIKSSHWHKGMIGKIVNVGEADQHGVVYVNQPGTTHHGNGLWAGDYEEVTGDIFQQPMKFRTPTRADSERIQRALFGLGASWGLSGTTPEYTSYKFLYVSKSGNMTHSNGESYFDGHDNTEYVIDRDGDIALPPPENKFATVDGVKYELPDWAKFVTRDRKEAHVWAWEYTPVWDAELQGYYTSGKGTAVIVQPYVEPKPEGSFIVEVA